MGAQHYRDLQATLLHRAAAVGEKRDLVLAHERALHWEGPKGNDFRARQTASVGHLERLIGEAHTAAAAAGHVADEIDQMMAKVRALLHKGVEIADVVWNESGEIVSVVSNGVSYTIDRAGEFVDGAGRVLGSVYDNTIGKVL